MSSPNTVAAARSSSGRQGGAAAAAASGRQGGAAAAAAHVGGASLPIYYGGHFASASTLHSLALATPGTAHSSSTGSGGLSHYTTSDAVHSGESSGYGGVCTRSSPGGICHDNASQQFAAGRGRAGELVQQRLFHSTLPGELVCWLAYLSEIAIARPVFVLRRNSEPPSCSRNRAASLSSIE